MNSVPRLLGLALLVVLAALAAVLAGPAWNTPATAEPPRAHATATATPAPRPRVVSLAALSQRLAFPLALTSLALATALFASLALRSSRGGESRAPFASGRAELGALAILAENSAVQSAALTRERDVRRRAEEDSLLNQQLLNRSLEEKIRLGRDLHDGIIQSLYAAGLVIESARTVAPTDPAEADRRLSQGLASLNQTIRDVRTYITGLAPDNLRQAGFAQAVDALISELSAGRPVRFDLKIDDTAIARLTPEQGTEALQIAREAISNSLRHGGASFITVRLHPGDGEVCLLVQDNGAGFDPARRAGSGHGLENMQARARRLGGSLRLESHPGDGARVVLTLPLVSPA